MPKLENDKHERFCQEYLKDLNATQAYTRSFKEGLTNNTARTNGSCLLAKTNVQCRIQELKDERSKRVQITVDDIINDLISIKNTCIEKNEEGQFIDRSMIPSGIKTIELLGKHIGMWNDKNKSQEALETIESFLLKLK